MGLLDFYDDPVQREAFNRGLLSLGSSMLANNQMRPGQALGASMPQAMNAYDTSKKQLSYDAAYKDFAKQLESGEMTPEQMRASMLKLGQYNPQFATTAMGMMGKETPEFIRIAQAAGIAPGSPEFRKLVESKYSPSQVNNFGAPVAAVDANGNPVFIQPSKQGGRASIIPGVRPLPRDTQKAPTESQAKANAYLQQMQVATGEINSVTQGGFDPTSFTSQAAIKMSGGVTNPLASDEAQRYRQSQEQWAESFLRFKTGAASTKDEVERNIRTFFPQVGDTPAVIEQKNRMRMEAEQAVAAAGTSENQQPSQAERKVINGKTYIKQNGQWYEQ